MNVLQVNKFFWEFGGPERCMFETASLLEGAGHRVAYFAMDHPRNRDSPWSRYFVSSVDYGAGGARPRARDLPRTLGGTFWSFEARRRIGSLLAAFRPDVAHVHSIYHHISPSILPALRSAGVPVVQTCHDYQLVCPAYHLYIHHRREICERCLDGAFRHAVLNRCLKRSFLVSGLAAAAARFHRSSGVIRRNVDLWITPSRFLADKLAAGGFPPERIRHLPNVIDLRRFRPRYGAAGDVVYVGRLSVEKGIDTLVRAVGLVDGLRLTVVGEGDRRNEIERLASDVAPGRVSFAGHTTGDALWDIVRDATCLVLPSECYEIFGMVILEAYALGTPVVAADIGGIPEIVEDGRTGSLFPPGDAEALAARLRGLRDDRGRLEAMGRAGRAFVEGLCADHLARLCGIYAEAAERLRAERA